MLFSIVKFKICCIFMGKSKAEKAPAICILLRHVAFTLEPGLWNGNLPGFKSGSSDLPNTACYKFLVTVAQRLFSKYIHWARAHHKRWTPVSCWVALIPLIPFFPNQSPNVSGYIGRKVKKQPFVFSLILEIIIPEKTSVITPRSCRQFIYSGKASVTLSTNAKIFFRDKTLSSVMNFVIATGSLNSYFRGSVPGSLRW